MNVGITGIGHAVPAKMLTNQDLEKIVDTNDEWITSRTGIKERHVAEDGEGVSALAAKAGQKALMAAGLKAEDVDLLILGTTTPDMPLPSSACIVQEKLGLTNAACFDLSAACSGFVYAMTTAQQFVLAGTYQNALVIGADKISSYLDWKDRGTCILFGDGAGACILQAVSSRGIIHSDLGSDGRYVDLIKIPGGGSCNRPNQRGLETGDYFLKMQGAEVFKQAVRGMGDSVSRILEKTSTKPEDIKCIVPHQANLRIIDAVAKRLGLDPKKIFLNLDRYGNTSAASVVIALSEAVEQNKIGEGDLVLMTTFGAGLVWGSALLQWGK